MDTDDALDRLPQRRKNRMRAVEFLYQWEMNPPEQFADAVATFFANQKEARDYYAFAEELIVGAVKEIELLDSKIREHSTNWRFDRIAKVDLSVLRLAIYELLFRKDIPPIVSINEAIELGKLYSTPDSKRFINGILDRMKESIGRPLREASE